MNTPKAAAPIDPADVAEQLANTFYASATALRDSADGLPDADADRINEKADALEEQGDGFTAQAIGAILGTIQADLGKIQAVTAEANDQFGKLKTVEEIITVATLVLAVGTAAASGDSAAIIKAVQALGDGLTGTAAAAATATAEDS